MATLEEKIDKIAENVSYMRGQWDSVIPQMQTKQASHDKSIDEIKSKQDTMAGKATIIGGIMGAVGGAILSVLSTKL